MPSTSESKASRTARACAASPVAAGLFAGVVWRRPVFEGFAVLVFVLVTCAKADAESAAASDATKNNFLSIAETPLSKISRRAGLSNDAPPREIKVQTRRAASRRRFAERSRPTASN